MVKHLRSALHRLTAIRIDEPIRRRLIDLLLESAHHAEHRLRQRLRPVLLGALARRSGYGRVVLIAGARGPAEFLFTEQLDAWRTDPAPATGLEVLLTVDQPTAGWDGRMTAGESEGKTQRLPERTA